MDLGLVLIGAFVGLLVGLTGVGGAALLTPILIMFGIQPIIAVGTDLVYNSITKVFGTLQHWRQKSIQWSIVFYFALGSVPSAIIAVHLLHWIEQTFGNADQVIKEALGFALILIPIATIIKNVKDRKRKQPNRWQQMENSSKRKLTVLIGIVLGFIVGLTSIGSGSLFALALMYFFQLSGKEIVGTDIAHALFLVSAAGLTHMGYGNVHYAIVFQLLIGSIPGVLTGSILSTRLPTTVLRYTILTLILLSGIKLI
ncbi:sulfite exporter TauE/SafE family protein [Ammoniphilus resinae]|uniref:Probable membrane transporter protein n=1 Tax=Ammoniphilus resinae TaxID=861532 RepID=A0ABS4GN61_9BACL|nr:sulfite exporter TauE/SafE family protein [Ammoniphilus resinae]MBP1931703.1 putative membrane protein YfcA [Ammoniphilus resinae]